MSRKFIIEVQETTEGDLFIEFPQEIIDELGLIEGDVMKYEIGDDGESFIIKKDDTSA